MESAGRGRDRRAWVAAAIEAIRAGGVQAVRVESLARCLGVTKGSFYWHFRNRADLLEAVLIAWERETVWLIRTASAESGPRRRLRRYFALVAAERRYPPDTEILDWARRDPDIAPRVARTERRRLAFLRRELQAAGLSQKEAARRARVAYLATQGWIERIGRGVESYASLPRFTAYLFRLLLGSRRRASAGSLPGESA